MTGKMLLHPKKEEQIIDQHITLYPNVPGGQDFSVQIVFILLLTSNYQHINKIRNIRVAQTLVTWAGNL